MLTQRQIADRNIKLYVIVRTFAKRVFLPLSAIYFIDTAGFTIGDIGLLAAVYSFVQLIAEVPTGYFADRVGRVASIRLGGLLAASATIIYVTLHTKIAIFGGAMLEALAYSFLGGAGEAMIHDSLIVKKQEHEYAKVMSRTMAISLVANAILLATIPMTYALDPRYPFILGTLAYLSLFVAGLYMHDVARPIPTRSFSLPSFSKMVGLRHILLFGLTFGIISSLYTSPTDFVFVALREYGLRPDHLGWIITASSIVGAALGPFMHYLYKLRLSRYLVLDVGLLLSLYLAAYSRSASVLAITIVVVLGFWRYRKIIYQNYLLHAYPTAYKTTLLSTMNNCEQLNNVYVPLVIGFAIGHTNTAQGFGIMGMFCLIIAPIYLSATLRFFHKAKSREFALANATTHSV